MGAVFDCIGGFYSYRWVADWDTHLRKSSTIQNFYEKNPKLARWIFIPASVPLGIAKYALEPVIALVSVVVFPIFAIIKQDSTYWYATAFALMTLTMTALTAYTYFFWFSGTTAIIMIVTEVAFCVISQANSWANLKQFNGQERDFWSNEYFNFI